RLAPHGPELPPVAATSPVVPLPEARQATERAIDGLRRALRAETLRERIGIAFTALSDYAGRLRRERTEAMRKADGLVAERERVRAKLRRLNEYRDLVAAE